ncbi:MAG: enoyl-CoA hydratase/isomerase family protein [Deltaproteobacteria bacterium]|nr:enoyl-CoA hydratase/isomerase family protein [Deltaproteobacteria bacterium]
MNESDDNMLLVEKKDYIGFLTLNYPEKRNALTPEMLLAIHENLETFLKNDDVRCLVVKGSGNQAFSSGYDISAIPVSKLPDTKQKPPDILLKALKSIKNFACPTIAMLNGHAFGAGFNLCACCDIRIAADDVKLGMTPARLGVVYHPEGIQQFIEAFGIARTKEIFFTANTFHGKELLRKGLVNYMVPQTDLEEFTHTYAQKITMNAPLSLKGIKNIISMFEDNLALNKKDLKKADRLMQQCFESRDLKEGQAAFLEKRVPKFNGK